MSEREPTAFEETCKPILAARLEWVNEHGSWPSKLRIGPYGYKALESEEMEQRIFGMDVTKREQEGFELA